MAGAGFGVANTLVSYQTLAQNPSSLEARNGLLVDLALLALMSGGGARPNLGPAVAATMTSSASLRTGACLFEALRSMAPVLEASTSPPRSSKIGGSSPSRNGRGVPNRGKGSPDWANSSTPGADGTVTGGLKGHAAKHGGEGGIVPVDTQLYYDQAVANINNGQLFSYRYGGQTKQAFITKVGEDSYLFTATTQSKKLIFTHMLVRERYLNNIGITLSIP